MIDIDVPQSMVVFGSAGIARDDPDFIPALVMDYILGGGGFGSRLTREMREKRGLTYGVYTYACDRELGRALHGLLLELERARAEALGILREEWARMAEERRD